MRKQKDLYLHKVIGCTKMSENTYMLSFERKFDFIPGQVVAVALSLEHDPRLYSLASDNRAKEMSIFFDVYEAGFLTPKLAELNPGDELLVSEPFGKFVSSDKDEWWIATGTGVAPFVSRLKSDTKMPLRFIQGARYVNQFYFQEYINDSLLNRYLRFCTKEDGEGVIRGRLTKWLSEQNDLPKDIKYYLCGNPEMVVEVRDIILDKGVDFENIMAEIYF